MEAIERKSGRALKKEGNEEARQLKLGAKSREVSAG